MWFFNGIVLWQRTPYNFKTLIESQFLISNWLLDWIKTKPQNSFSLVFSKPAGKRHKKQGKISFWSTSIECCNKIINRHTIQRQKEIILSRRHIVFYSAFYNHPSNEIKFLILNKMWKFNEEFCRGCLRRILVR